MKIFREFAYGVGAGFFGTCAVAGEGLGYAMVACICAAFLWMEWKR